MILFCWTSLKLWSSFTYISFFVHAIWISVSPHRSHTLASPKLLICDLFLTYQQTWPFLEFSSFLWHRSVNVRNAQFRTWTWMLISTALVHSQFDSVLLLYHCVFMCRLFLDHRRTSDHRVEPPTPSIMSVRQLTRARVLVTFPSNRSARGSPIPASAPPPKATLVFDSRGGRKKLIFNIPWR